MSPALITVTLLSAGDHMTEEEIRRAFPWEYGNEEIAEGKTKRLLGEYVKLTNRQVL